jgi:DNA repair exonuclease SbcCD nuclease subunit
MLRILHSADWQLGMTRHFLAGEAPARSAADRLDAVRALLRLAADERCEAVVVAGDVFETNQVDRRTVAQALDALGTSSGSQHVPVYLLPGNHDPLDAASVFRSRSFLAAKPPHVHVLDTAEPRRLPSGAEIVGAPWSSKRPLSDLVADAARALEPTDVPRVLVGHGAVDAIVAVDRENPALVSLAAAEQAIAERRFHYLALGDRHSPTKVGSTGRIWYAGSQEATDFDEIDPGRALVVEVGPESCTVTPHRVGRWTFLRDRFELVSDADLDAVRQRLLAIDDKQRAIAKLGFQGTLTLRQRARLDDILEEARHLFAAVIEWERMSEIAVRPDADDLAGIELSGFARRAAERLRDAAAGAGSDAEAARGALALLFRLARSDA